MKTHACGTPLVQTHDAIGRVRDRCPRCHGVAAPRRRQERPTVDDETERVSAFLTESEE